MYQVLYRKWRPKVFSDVIGQPQVTVTLCNELQSGRIAHAFLFTGSRGTGKTTCAKILSKAVNCLNPSNGDPCGICEMCKGIDNGSIMDVVEIDAASNNGVDNIRNLREEAYYTPSTAKFRVYIIDEVHMLSDGAFNALLKILEEPPAHVVFILATTEIHKIPATILSRCQRFDFHRINPEYVAQRLIYVANEENAVLHKDAALLIARLSDGALRDALSLLDKCLGHSNDITEDIVSETAGLAGRDHLFELTDALAKKDCAIILNKIDALHTASKDMARLCEELITHLRNLMLLKTIDDAHDLILVTEQEYKRLEQQTFNIRLADILYALEVFQETLEKMFHGANRRVEIEMAFIKLCTPQLSSSVDSILSRLSKLEETISKGEFTVAVSSVKENEEETLANKGVLEETPSYENVAEIYEEQKKEEPKKVTKTASPIGGGLVNPPNAKELQSNAKPLECWDEILERLKKYSPALATVLVDSSAYINDSLILIDAPHSMAFTMLRDSSQKQMVRVAIREVLGKQCSLGPYKKTSTEDVQASSLSQLINKAKQSGVNVISE